MASSHAAAESQADASKPYPSRKPAQGGGRWYIPVVVLILGGAAGVGWWLTHGHKTSHGAEARGENEAAVATSTEAQEPDSSYGEATHVEVVHPKPGGVDKVTTQPGSVHAFEFADLEAKVSGYLVKQTVDIGDQVKKGKLLAEIDDPEVVVEAKRAAAQLELVKAQVTQASKRVESAVAFLHAAEARVRQAQADVERYVAEHHYRDKQYNRMLKLFQQRGVDEKLVDEERDRLDAAIAAEHSAQATVATNDAERVEAEAKVDQAKADLKAAEAQVDVEQANLDKANVLVGYTKILSPYDGVITHREFHVGEFIRSAAEGGVQSLLRVARTDLMRIVVQIPDSDVPYLDKDDPATLTVATLGGQQFKGKVSRLSYSEDPETRTMRIEVDIPNTGGKLQEGMYGSVTVMLQPASKDANTVMIPSACLVGESNQGTATVYVIRDKKAHLQKVKKGVDNGIELEVLSGLTPSDLVALPTNGVLGEGQPVVVEETSQNKRGK